MTRTPLFVQIGRVGMVNSGPYAGKLATIVEIIDHKRVIVDGGAKGVPRRVLPIRSFDLINKVVKIGRETRTKFVAKAMKKADVLTTFKRSARGIKLQMRNSKANMTDFEKFKSLKFKKKVSLAKMECIKKSKKASRA